MMKQIVQDGLWSRNPALVQLLGLCPLLAVSNNFTTSLGLGITTLAVLTISNITVSLLRSYLDESTRIPIQILIIAGFVTLADLLLQYQYFELHQRIGLFVALIVTNCTLLGRAELFASRHPAIWAGLDGLMMGIGFLAVLLVMGSIRELLGNGTLFSELHLLIGGDDVEIRLTDARFLLAVMPPGAFLTLGCLIALKNIIDQKLKEHERRKTLPDSVSP
tara:strand:- start:187 stop:846 length:660 start_codon:yes stop_codon:yes gene_type:complete